MNDRHNGKRSQCNAKVQRAFMKQNYKDLSISDGMEISLNYFGMNNEKFQGPGKREGNIGKN